MTTSKAAQRVIIRGEDKAWGVKITKKKKKKKYPKYKNKILKKEGRHICTLQFLVVLIDDRVTN